MGLKYFQEQAETMPAEELRKLQSEKLVKQVRHVYDHCAPYRRKMEEIIFKNTTTIGIRYSFKERFILDRREETVSTKYGDVKVKISEGFGVKKVKPGYDDVSGITDKI